MTINKFFTCVSYALALFLLPVISVADSATTLADNRMQIFNALNEQNLLTKGRQLVRLVHLCNLIVNDKQYPVIDVKEHVKGAQVPRGLPYIFVLNSSLKLEANIFNSGPVVPLYCRKNQLFLHGHLDIDGSSVEGNILTFSKTESGLKFVLSDMEPNDFPIQDVPQ